MTSRILKIILVLIPATIFALCAGCSSNKDTAPHARQGVIDLSAIDWSSSAPVRLDGEWEFYWKQLLSPDNFRVPPSPPATTFLTLPAAWNSFTLNGQKLGGEGFATFRLKILPGAMNREMALHFDDLNSAFKLWANGKLIVESGVVGRNAAEETPNQAIKQPKLTIGNQPVELVLQISNHHYREGGVVSSIVLGPVDKLESSQLTLWALALICIGSLMVMGLYHIGLFCFRRKDIAPLYFGIYCLLWMTCTFTTNASDWAVRLIFESYPALFINRLDLLCFVISVPVGFNFFRSLYPQEFSFRLQQTTWVMASLFTVLGLTVSTMSFTNTIPVYYVFSIAMILYCLAMLFKAMLRRREGASLIFLGFIVMGVTGINDMLFDLQLISSVYLIHIGMLVFILFQAIALSVRFSRSFDAVIQLSGELSEQNLTLEEEMLERTRLEREIVNVSEDERRRISHDLHDGLCQKLTAARLHFSVLAKKLKAAEMQQPEVAEVSSLLEDSVNQAYDLSRGLWPVEHDPHEVSPSLEELTRRLAESSGIVIEFSQERRCVNCSNTSVIQLYRIAQEAITNAVKHARASRILVALDCHSNRSALLTVQDNGIGRSTAAKTKGGMGMGIMSHRARIVGGKLTVTDAEGEGTMVTCTVPCEVELTEG